VTPPSPAAAGARTSKPPTTPTKLGPYDIVGRIGAGGMAEVLLGRRAGPGGFAKPVAVKRLLPEVARDEDLRAMFVEEARLQAGLSHRNLVQVFDFGEDAGERFLVMEYVEGTDLAALIGRNRRVAPPLALLVAAEIAEGLDYLHARGIVHRDVSPGNVYLSRAGEVKLGDFGIAKGRAQALRTERGRLKGKLAYLAPEQARGDAVDARADLYALGLILFEMLSGERYLQGEGEADVLRAAMEPVPRPAGAGDAADAVVARLLEPRREDRPSSARLAAQAIRGAQAALGSAPGSAALAALVEGVAPPRDLAAPPLLRQVTERLRPRSRRGWAWLGGGSTLLAVVAWIALRPAAPAPTTPAAEPARAPGHPPAAVSPPAAPVPVPNAPKPARPVRRAAPAAPPSPAPTVAEPPVALPPPSAPPPVPAPEPAPDRAAIERRLATLGTRLQNANLESTRRDEARRLAQQALDSTIEQRYSEAARKLDALEALLDHAGAAGRKR